MKKLLLLLSLFFCFGSAEAQFNYNFCWGGIYPVISIDSFSFENNMNNLGKIVIDTTYTNNIWQIGAVQKPGFNNAYSGITALQTDTLNNYPVNNESAAIVYADTNTMNSWVGSGNNFSLCFWHYYDTDTLSDSCILQMTTDSGKTWKNDIMDNWGSNTYGLYYGSLNHYDSIPIYFPVLYWSGKSNGWVKECICEAIPGVKGQPISRPFGFRFLFHSDSIQTNKPGWMIDDITLKTPEFFGGIVNDHLFQSANIYPNPSSNGIFNIDYPQHYVKGTVEIFNVFGQRIKTLPLSPSINLQDIPRGIYHYTIFFQTTAQQFSGTLVYE